MDKYKRESIFFCDGDRAPISSSWWIILTSIWVDMKLLIAQVLTLPGVNARGFLVHRQNLIEQDCSQRKTRMPYCCKSTLHHYLGCCNVPICFISTFTAPMNPLTQLFLARVMVAIRTSLTGSIGIDLILSASPRPHLSITPDDRVSQRARAMLLWETAVLYC